MIHGSTTDPDDPVAPRMIRGPQTDPDDPWRRA
jgi:hypothetical protein